MNKAILPHAGLGHNGPSAPDLDGFARVWSDEFDGPLGSGVDSTLWNVIESTQNANNEVEIYTSSSENISLDGHGALQIIPVHELIGPHWTSGRLEGKTAVGCDPFHKMIFQASIGLGEDDASRQNGIWPAFWALGGSFREGVPWPKCGEWDIFETKNTLGFDSLGTLHFLNADGTHNDGFSGRVTYDPEGSHVWSIEVDRTSGQTATESLTWKLDGQTFFQVTGAQVGSDEQWAELAHKEYFPVLNVAVGGDFPGNPDLRTKGGPGSGMFVDYVAIYKSNT